MIIICDNYIDGIFKTANFKFLNLNTLYVIPTLGLHSPPASKVQKNLCNQEFYEKYLQCAIKLFTKKT